jgi:hypothetical protein
MSDGTFVQGDTAPDITVTLYKADGTTPLDLEGALGVKFQMRKADDRRFTVDAAADIDDDPTTGKVSYRWAVGDLAVPGDYQVQWEVTYGDGRIQTTAVPNEISVRRQ